MAVIQRMIVPSNQTFQDTYLKASAFAGQNKTPEAFEKAAASAKLSKRSAQNVKEMDNQVSGLTSVRELVRWAFSENVKIGEVSPVFDLSGKYVVANLKNTYDKGLLPLEKIKERIEPNVKNYKKIELLTEKMKKAFANQKDLYMLAAEFNAKVDTTDIMFSGYGRSAIANDGDVVGTLFTLKTGVVSGPFTGKFGAYFVIVDSRTELAKKEDFSAEKAKLIDDFTSRSANSSFMTLMKIANIKDNRSKFF